MAKLVSEQQAAAHIRSGDRVFIHGGAATPRVLVNALVERFASLHDVEIVHLHTEGTAPYTAPEMAGHFRHNALFIGPNVRQAVQEGRADYTPVFLSEIPALFRADSALPLDVALIQVAPPQDGQCSLGVSVDCALAAAEQARLVIAQVNPKMPYTFGHGLPLSRIGFLVDGEADLPPTRVYVPNPEAKAIAQHVAALIEDGSALQIGIGTVPEAVLDALQDHRDLGVHSEMFSDGVMQLVKRGVITGARKTIDRGVIVSSFVLGSRALYAFIHENPSVQLRPVDYTNNVDIIARNERVVAINSAISVDLTGQVVSDSIGPRFFSGIGGQVDFIRGAARSRGGKPIIALPSTAADGSISRITVSLDVGAGVVTTRGDVHWVVTEYGARNLHGRTVRERARMLIEIAHPKFRTRLEEEAHRIGYLHA